MYIDCNNIATASVELSPYKMSILYPKNPMQSLSELRLDHVIFNM